MPDCARSAAGVVEFVVLVEERVAGLAVQVPALQRARDVGVETGRHHRVLVGSLVADRIDPVVEAVDIRVVAESDRGVRVEGVYYARDIGLRALRRERRRVEAQRGHDSDRDQATGSRHASSCCFWLENGAFLHDG